MSWSITKQPIAATASGTVLQVSNDLMDNEPGSGNSSEPHLHIQVSDSSDLLQARTVNKKRMMCESTWHPLFPTTLFRR